MIIDITDVRVGDEVIVGSHSNLRYLKVIRPPRLRKKPGKWGAKYTNTWCSSKIDIIEHPRGNGTYTWTHKETKRHCAPPLEHNIERYENLNFKMIWLVKREKI
jgi:hypothetical protein